MWEPAFAGDGSRFRGMAPGSRRAAGGFWFGHCSAGSAPPVFIAEGAIDTLSAAALGIGASIHASTAGVCRHLPDWLEGFAPASLVCGFDADGAGDGAAAALAAADGRVTRLRPSGAKDWNEMLTGAGHPAPGSPGPELKPGSGPLPCGSAPVAQAPAVVPRSR